MRKRPKHLSFACRPGDIAAAAEQLGLDLSFCRVHFGEHTIPHQLRGPHPPRRFEVARAHASHFGDLSGYIFPDFSVTMQLVPRPLAGAVREVLRAGGLVTLLRWLDEKRRLPETARTSNVALHLGWDEGRLVAWEGETPGWDLSRSP